MAVRAAGGEIDGYVWLPPGLPAGESASYEARHATNMREVRRVRSAVDDAVREARLARPDRRLDPLRGPPPGPVRGARSDPEGHGAAASGEAMIMTAIIAVFVIYFIILLYGNTVLRGVREEKENRVVEIILSSIRAEQLMAGKVFGIGGACLLQVAIWVAVAALVAAFGEDLVRAVGGQPPRFPASRCRPRSSTSFSSPAASSSTPRSTRRWARSRRRDRTRRTCSSPPCCRSWSRSSWRSA